MDEVNTLHGPLLQLAFLFLKVPYWSVFIEYSAGFEKYHSFKFIVYFHHACLPFLSISFYLPYYSSLPGLPSVFTSHIDDFISLYKI